MRTSLFKVVGTQPDGIASLRLEDFYRTITVRQAAELANNFWKLHGVQMSRFEVTYYIEPEHVGRVVSGKRIDQVFIYALGRDGKMWISDVKQPTTSAE